MKNKILFILLGLLVLFVVFLTADFNFTRSETTSEHNLTTIRQGDEIPTPTPSEQNLIVDVVGEGAFADKLREALLAELTASNLVDQGQWVATPDATAMRCIWWCKWTITRFSGRLFMPRPQ
jgi:hypothetical protein